MDRYGNKTQFDDLPDDVVSLILTELNIKDLAQTKLINRNSNLIIKNDRLFEKKALEIIDKRGFIFYQLDQITAQVNPKIKIVEENDKLLIKIYNIENDKFNLYKTIDISDGIYKIFSLKNRAVSSDNIVLIFSETYLYVIRTGLILKQNKKPIIKKSHKFKNISTSQNTISKLTRSVVDEEDDFEDEQPENGDIDDSDIIIAKLNALNYNKILAGQDRLYMITNDDKVLKFFDFRNIMDFREDMSIIKIISKDILLVKTDNDIEYLYMIGDRGIFNIFFKSLFNSWIKMNIPNKFYYLYDEIIAKMDKDNYDIKLLNELLKKMNEKMKDDKFILY